MHQVFVLRQKIAGAGVIIIGTDDSVHDRVRHDGRNPLGGVRLHQNIGIQKKQNLALGGIRVDVARRRDPCVARYLVPELRGRLRDLYFHLWSRHRQQ